MTSCDGRTRTVAATFAGALAWLATPWLPFGTPPPAGSLVHVFLFLPLVAVPLLLALASTLLQPRGAAAAVHGFARRVQPIASAAVLASFTFPLGTLAGALVLPWLALGITLAIASVVAVMQGCRPHRASVSLFAAHVFLPLAGVWLLLSRLGTGPSHLGALDVFLAVVHFHFSGFALQVLIAATAHRVPPTLAGVQRGIAIASVAGIPLIASGKLLQVDALKVLGVTTMIVVTLTVAVLSFAIARASRPGLARGLLLTASASVAAAMLIAATHGLGQVIGAHWLGVERMVTTHGLLNAVGFIACGTIAHLRARARAPSRTRQNASRFSTPY